MKVQRACDRPMMTDAPVMNPEMTECDRKLVSQPSRSTPTSVYRQPAKNATCAPGLLSCHAHPQVFSHQGLVIGF